MAQNPGCNLTEQKHSFHFCVHVLSSWKFGVTSRLIKSSFPFLCFIVILYQSTPVQIYQVNPDFDHGLFSAVCHHPPLLFSMLNISEQLADFWCSQGSLDSRRLISAQLPFVSSLSVVHCRCSFCLLRLAAVIVRKRLFVPEKDAEYFAFVGSTFSFPERLVLHRFLRYF